MAYWERSDPKIANLLKLAKLEFYVLCSDNPFGTVEEPLDIAHDGFAHQAITTQLTKAGRSDVEITTRMKATVSGHKTHCDLDSL